VGVAEDSAAIEAIGGVKLMAKVQVRVRPQVLLFQNDEVVLAALRLQFLHAAGQLLF